MESKLIFEGQGQKTYAVVFNKVVIEETPKHLSRKIDPGTGLALLDLGGG